MYVLVNIITILKDILRSASKPAQQKFRSQHQRKTGNQIEDIVKLKIREKHINKNQILQIIRNTLKHHVCILVSKSLTRQISIKAHLQQF